MSYNIDSTEEIELDAWMLATDICDIADGHEDWLPECSFIDEHLDEAREALESGIEELQRVRLRNFWWCGEGSGNRYNDHLLKHIAPKVMGTVEAVFTWEGGDSHSGLLIRDGQAAECEVEFQVVRPEGWDAETGAAK